MAIEHAHLDDRAGHAGWQLSEVSRTSDAFLPKMARSSFSSGVRALALWRDLADQDVAGIHLGADIDDAGLIEVRNWRPAGPVRICSSPPVDIGAALRALARHRPLRLATFGYLGHMWELYALWSWLSAFFVASRLMHRPDTAETGTVTFLAIGVAGLLGAVAAGRLADRLGRTAITSGAMLISAACAWPARWPSARPGRCWWPCC